MISGLKDAKRITFRYWKLLTLLMVCTFIATGLEAISISLLFPLLTAIFNPEGNKGDSYGIILDKLNHALSSIPQDKIFVTVIILFFMATLLKVIFRIGRNIFRIVVSQRVKVDCQKDMYEKYMHSDMKYFIHSKGGDLVFRIINLPNEVSLFFTLFPTVFIEGCNIFILSMLLVTISPILFFIVFFVGLVFAFIVSYMSKNVFKRSGKKCMHALSWQNIIVNESLLGIREIITYGGRGQWVDRFGEQCKNYYKVKKTAGILKLVPGNMLELIIVGLLAGVGLFLGIRYEDKLITVLPVLAIYAMAIIRMVPSFIKISQDYAQLAVLSPAIHLYEGFLKERTSDLTEGRKTFQTFEKLIRFKNVGFGYTKTKVFNNLNLEIPKNKKIAIVGGSGSGKSTLIDLLLGLYQPEEGQIEIDGFDLKEYSFKTWRNKIGVVPQNSTIFNANVKENITLDFHGAVDMDKIISAAKLAEVHEFIEKLDEGYETRLGDRGFKLSGGQRQRIAIARALYRDPEIIIFDEATSALDYRTEQMIAQTIDSLANKKTIIILAHRLSTIKDADMIYVLKDGVVYQSGAHDELLQKDGEYRDLYQRHSH